MQISLTNKVAIVTGSVQGIGLAIAEVLAQCGARVVINHYRDADRLASAEKLLQEKYPGQVKGVLADVTRRSDAVKLIDTALQMGDSIDILVNNAGGLIKRVPVAEFDEEHYQRVMDVNVKSAFLMSHLVLPHMKKQKSGKIINLSSQAAHDGGGGGAAAYSASKGAIWTFTKSLAKEAAAFGIHVNCLSPGFIASTTFHDTFTPKEVQETIVTKIPLQRGGTSRDVANAALFLASGLSDYMTGQSVEVNGGFYMP